MWNEKKKAIETLKKQIKKIEDDPELILSNWHMQTATYMKVYFGDDSMQYLGITDITSKYGAIEMLNSCIEIIEDVGFVLPKSNILSRKSNFELLVFAIILYGAGFKTNKFISDNISPAPQKTFIETNSTSNKPSNINQASKQNKKCAIYFNHAHNLNF